MKMIVSWLCIILLCSVQANAGYWLGHVQTAGGVSAFDDFNRTNYDPLGNLSGGTYSWSEAVGSGYTNNNVAHGGTGGRNLFVLSTAIDISSGTIAATINAEDLTWSFVGIVFGYEGTDDFWLVRFAPSATNDTTLMQYVSGSGSDEEVYNADLALSTDYDVTVRWTSSTVQVDIDGVGTNLINATGLTIASGNVGFLIERASTAKGTVDDWDLN